MVFIGKDLERETLEQGLDRVQGAGARARPEAVMTDLDELQAIEPGDLLADRAYRQLSRAILATSCRRRSTQRAELARRLNISRSPVREAVQRLIYDGLAANVPHRGAIVSELKPDDFRGLLEVRQALEGLAARLATMRATDERAPLAPARCSTSTRAWSNRATSRQRRARHPLPQHHPRDGWQRRAQHDPAPDPGPCPPVALHAVARQAQHQRGAGTSTTRSSPRWRP